MSKYPKEFREQIVALCNAGKRPSMLSREYDVPVQNIYSWLRRQNESLQPKQVLIKIVSFRVTFAFIIMLYLE